MKILKLKFLFSNEGLTHIHAFDNDLPSQKISELLGNITESAKMEFFKRQTGRHVEKEYLAFSTPPCIILIRTHQVSEYGKNQEGDALPQVNPVLLSGEMFIIAT